MGPMTVSPTLLSRDGNDIKLSVNMSSVGKQKAVLKQQINST